MRRNFIHRNTATRSSNMNAIELAKAAQQDAQQYASVLSSALVRKVELAYIAQWLDAQDLSVRARAATTACSAIDFLRINDTAQA
jgi:hypothetical protein